MNRVHAASRRSWSEKHRRSREPTTGKWAQRSCADCISAGKGPVQRFSGSAGAEDEPKLWKKFKAANEEFTSAQRTLC